MRRHVACELPAVLSSVAVGALISASSSVAFAVDRAWEGKPNSGNGAWWDQTSNWQNGQMPAAGDRAVFGAAGAVVTNYVAEVAKAKSANISVAGLQFLGSVPWTVTQGSGGTLTLASSGSVPSIDLSSGSSANISVPLGGQAGFIKTGDGWLTLSGANVFTGRMEVNAGTVSYGVATNSIVPGSIYDTATIKVSGGTLAMGAYTDTVGGVSLIGGSITGSGTGALTSTTAFDMQAGTVSAILGGTSGLSKSTGGTVTLSGQNTYTGATSVTGGTLIVNGAINAGSLTTVATGATLAGVGTLGGLTIQSGGTVSPGAPGSLTSASLTTGAQTWQSGGIYEVTATSLTGGSTTVKDGVTYGGAAGDSMTMSSLSISSSALSPFTINLARPAGVTFAGTEGTVYQWLIGAVTGGLTGTPTGINVTSNFAAPGQLQLFTVDNATGTDYLYVSYSYSAVPEATTLLLGFAGLTPVLLQRRSQRRFRRAEMAA